MESEFLAALTKATLAASAAAAAVMLMRSVFRARFGAKAAYGLWALVPCACLAALLPAREIRIAAPVAPEAAAAPQAAIAPPERLVGNPEETAPFVGGPAVATLYSVDGLIVWVWLAGAGAFCGVLVLRQRAFERTLGALTAVDAVTSKAALCTAGPAMLGVLRPRIVLPADFEERFTEEERALILAHERAHIEAGDGLANLAAAAAQCAFWFNPLVHLAARAFRKDQELACDEKVMREFPSGLRAYAEALVKAQAFALSAPIASAWPPRPGRFLKTRIGALARVPSPRAARAGAASASLFALGAGAAAWGALPPVTTYVASGAATAASASPLVAVVGAPSLRIEQIAARVKVVPEARPDFAVDVTPVQGLPEPTITAKDGVLVIDGGVDYENHPCKEPLSAGGAADVPGYGRRSRLVEIVVRAPRSFNLSVAGAVTSEIGAADEAALENHACGPMRAEGAKTLDVSLFGLGGIDIVRPAEIAVARLYGLGDLRLAAAGRLRAVLFGTGDIVAEDVSEKFEAKLQGTGAIRVASAKGAAAIDLPGAGDVLIERLSGRLSVKGAGAGIVRVEQIDAPHTDLDLEGAVNVVLPAGEAGALDARIESGAGADIGARAGPVSVFFARGGGDLVLRNAGAVRESRGPGASGRVVIGSPGG